MAKVLGRGEGAARYVARGSVMLFKALAAQDDGDFSLMERTLPAGGRRPPTHRHAGCSEAYFVLDGTVSVVVDGDELLLGPEDFVLVPRGVPHTFGNGGDGDGTPPGAARPGARRLLRRPPRVVEPRRATHARRGARPHGAVRHGDRRRLSPPASDQVPPAISTSGDWMS